MTNMDLWYSRMDADAIQQRWGGDVSVADARAFQRRVRKAMGKDSLSAAAKLTQLVNGERRMVSDPPLIVPIVDLLDEDQRLALERTVKGALRTYSRTLSGDRRHLLEQFTYVDMARKVVGVGSVGTRAWVVLMLGIDHGDPLILQAKEATASVLEGFTETSPFESHGQRVVEGQRLMQAYGDILLGWHHFPDSVRPDYYIRQLRDWKGSFEVATLDPQALAVYAKYCAWTLARAHARSGDRVAIAAYIDDQDVFDQAIADFSVAYADKNEQDFARLQEAASAGTISVQHGV
jgi:uncharacterized protein (DUF2252 family)